MACGYAHTVCRQGTGATMRCPYCGEEIVTHREQLRRMREANERIDRLLREMKEEARKARAEREGDSAYVKPQQHWGSWRKRQPSWAKGAPFVKQTKRPRRYRR